MRIWGTREKTDDPTWDADRAIWRASDAKVWGRVEQVVDIPVTLAIDWTAECVDGGINEDLADG